MGDDLNYTEVQSNTILLNKSNDTGNVNGSISVDFVNDVKTTVPLLKPGHIKYDNIDYYYNSETKRFESSESTYYFEIASYYLDLEEQPKLYSELYLYKNDEYLTLNQINAYNNDLSIFENWIYENEYAKPIEYVLDKSISYFDINVFGNNESHIRFNGHEQNTSGGIVVLDENGKLSKEIYNGITVNDTGLIGKGTEEEPLKIKYGKGLLQDNDGISINPNDLIFLQELTIGNEQNHITFSNSGIQLNDYFLNECNGLVKLDANGYIIDDCLLKLIEITFNEQIYQIIGGIYTIFNNPISSLKLRTEFNTDNYLNFNKYGYIRFICGSEDINIEFPIQAKLIGTIPTFELNKVYLIKYLRNEFEISQITKLQLSDDYVIMPRCYINYRFWRNI